MSPALSYMSCCALAGSLAVLQGQLQLMLLPVYALRLMSAMHTSIHATCLCGLQVVNQYGHIPDQDYGLSTSICRHASELI